MTHQNLAADTVYAIAYYTGHFHIDSPKGPPRAEINDVSALTTMCNNAESAIIKKFKNQLTPEESLRKSLSEGGEISRKGRREGEDAFSPGAN